MAVYEHLSVLAKEMAHISAVLRKVYAKIGALRRQKRLVPADVVLLLYKAYILLHMEYCSPLLLGINKTLINKLESANHYYLKSLLNAGNSLEYNSILSIANMQSLEQRRQVKKSKGACTYLFS